MNAEQTIAMYEARRKIAALNGNEDAEAHWTERIIRVSDQIEAARRQIARRRAPSWADEDA